jgi:hypothetical protein
MTAGGMVFYPTIDLPPDSFGTRENRQSEKLVDPETFEPQKDAAVLLGYFTTVGPKIDHIGGKMETTQFDRDFESIFA